jgi:hypothetical protein
VFALAALALTACGPETLVVGLEPTPTSVLRSYVNDTYGFSFRYPETWILTEEPHLLKVSRGDLGLMIAYGWASDPRFRPLGGRTGMPAGDFVYGGKISFLETTIPVRVLEHERRAKVILYGETSLVEAGELVFSIWLENRESDHAELDIPKERQAEAKQILESFERIEATGNSPALAPTATRTAEQVPTPSSEKDLFTYVNDDYQLAFVYPSGWEIEEIPAGHEIPDGASASAVCLTQDTLRLVVQFKRLGEETILGAGGLPAGELEEAGRVTVLGRDVAKQAVVYEGKVKSVFLRERFDDLALYVELGVGVGAETEYEAVEIPETAQAALDAIVGSLHRIGEAKFLSTETLTYENPSYGFSFHYPASWTVEEVVGEMVEDDVKLADAVVLRQGTLAIVVQYQRKSDSAQIVWGGDLVPGGLGYAEATLGAPVTLLEEDRHKRFWTYDGGVKAIHVNTTGKYADLILSISLADSSVRLIPDPEAEAIPESAAEALDQIIGSFALTQ